MPCRTSHQHHSPAPSLPGWVPTSLYSSLWECHFIPVTVRNIARTDVMIQRKMLGTAPFLSCLLTSICLPDMREPSSIPRAPPPSPAHSVLFPFPQPSFCSGPVLEPLGWQSAGPVDSFGSLLPICWELLYLCHQDLHMCPEALGQSPESWEVVLSQVTDYVII